ncbi:hypothetical protein [Streptomyces sp. NPDC058291]|uniref:hypothetical protein n=1 Tax=Streptomyces sp. NPDC058291 TaxID=3346427 RepID=UPI0036EC4606
MSTARRHARSRAWLRVLVLLLALLASGAPAEPTAPPAAVAGAEIGIGVGEHDVLDSALRPAPCVHRPVAPLRPAPVPAPAPAAAVRPHRTPPPAVPPYSLRVVRTVVLRC